MSRPHSSDRRSRRDVQLESDAQLNRSAFYTPEKNQVLRNRRARQTLKDLTPADVKKYTTQTKWPMPKIKDPILKKSIAQSIALDQLHEQDRFLRAVSNNVYKKMLTTPQVQTSIAMYQRIERYRQGAVGSADIGCSSHRAGFCNPAEGSMNSFNGISAMDVDRIQDTAFRKRTRLDRGVNNAQAGSRTTQSLEGQDPRPRWRTSDWKRQRTEPGPRDLSKYYQASRTAAEEDNASGNFGLLKSSFRSHRTF